ncbi:BAR domain-containing protein [Ditylenchus destructor]|uniref:BAR domain-containing protein n=1 Tax=Ditylenchus destructor TaxID=166010 RepID=A0AAD4R8J0_9BILA|nr:BAR domain-containing protein [Ditylenchus destructor]
MQLGTRTDHHMDNSSPGTIHHLGQFITWDSSSPGTIHHLGQFITWDSSSPGTIHHLGQSKVILALREIPKICMPVPYSCRDSNKSGLWRQSCSRLQPELEQRKFVDILQPKRKTLLEKLSNISDAPYSEEMTKQLALFEVCKTQTERLISAINTSIEEMDCDKPNKFECLGEAFFNYGSACADQFAEVALKGTLKTLEEVGEISRNYAENVEIEVIEPLQQWIINDYTALNVDVRNMEKARKILQSALAKSRKSAGLNEIHEQSRIGAEEAFNAQVALVQDRLQRFFHNNQQSHRRILEKFVELEDRYYGEISEKIQFELEATVQHKAIFFIYILKPALFLFRYKTPILAKFMQNPGNSSEQRPTNNTFPMHQQQPFYQSQQQSGANSQFPQTDREGTNQYFPPQMDTSQSSQASLLGSSNPQQGGQHQIANTRPEMIQGQNIAPSLMDMASGLQKPNFGQQMQQFPGSYNAMGQRNLGMSSQAFNKSEDKPQEMFSGNVPSQFPLGHSGQPQSGMPPAQRLLGQFAGTSIAQSDNVLLKQAKPTLDPRLQSLMPAIVPREMMENLENHSVEMLCSIGREITQDLAIRAMNLMSVVRLSVVNNIRNSPVSVASILSYCQTLFMKLAEIRIRIDLKRAAELSPDEDIQDTRISDEKLFDIFSDPNPPKMDPKKQQLTEQFESNRAELVKLSNHLKKLDWLAAASDPRFFKKLDSDRR